MRHLEYSQSQKGMQTRMNLESNEEELKYRIWKKTVFL